MKWSPAFVALVTGLLSSAIIVTESKPTGEDGSAATSSEVATGQSTEPTDYGSIGELQSSSQFHGPNEPGSDGDDEFEEVEINSMKDSEKKESKLPEFKWTVDPATMTQEMEIIIKFVKKGELMKTIKLVKNSDGTVTEDRERVLEFKGTGGLVVSKTIDDDDNDEAEEELFKNQGVIKVDEPSPKYSTRIEPGEEGVFKSVETFDTDFTTEEPYPIKPMDSETTPAIFPLPIAQTEPEPDESTETVTQGDDPLTPEEKKPESLSVSEVDTESTPEISAEPEISPESLMEMSSELPKEMTSEPIMEMESSTESITEATSEASTTEDDEEEEDDEDDDETTTKQPTTEEPTTEKTTNKPRFLHRRGDGHEAGDVQWGEHVEDEEAEKKKKNEDENGTTSPTATTTDDDDDGDDSDDDD